MMMISGLGHVACGYEVGGEQTACPPFAVILDQLFRGPGSKIRHDLLLELGDFLAVLIDAGDAEPEFRKTYAP